MPLSIHGAFEDSNLHLLHARPEALQWLSTNQCILTCHVKLFQVLNSDPTLILNQIMYNTYSAKIHLNLKRYHV